MAVVYSEEDPGLIFPKVYAALSPQPQLPRAKGNPIQPFLYELENSHPEISEKLDEWLTSEVYFQLAQNGFNVCKPGLQHVAEQLKTDLKESELASTNSNLQKLVNHLVEDFRKRHASSTPDNYFFSHSKDSNSANLWILAGNLFLVIACKKDTPADKLVDKLHDAIEEWAPSPNRLMLAKLRSEIDAAGIGPDNEILGDRVLQAYWLHMLLNSVPLDLKQHVEVLVDRQTELLTDLLRKNVTEYAERVLGVVKATMPDPLEATQRYLGVKLFDRNTFDEGMVAHNTHVSTKPASGKNLTTGHVLELGPDKEIWIILSPACDLEMGRGGRDLKKNMKPWMPFTALKLYKINRADSLRQATRGSVVFLNIRSSRRQHFSMFKPATTHSNPVWEEFFADEEGMLKPTMKIKVARFKKGGSAGQAPELDLIDGEVVAQLRSEYAANLAQKLTAHLARIGLDYQGSQAEDEQALEGTISTPPGDKI